MLLCMLEAVEGRLCLLEVLEVLDVPEVIQCVPLWMLEAVEAEGCLLEVPELMRCTLLCMLEAVERRLCLLEGWRRCAVCCSVC